MIRAIAALGCCLLLAAPAGAQPAGPKYLGDARPDGPPGRIVSLAPSLTEILFAIGAGDRVVGVTTYDDFPEAVRSLPRVGGFIDPSVEAILGLKPHIIVCVPNSGGRGRMEALARMGVPVLVLPSYSLEDVFTSISTLGKLTGREDAAAGLVRGMRVRIRRVRDRTRNLDRPGVLLIYGHKPIVAAGAGSFADRLLEMAGGRNILETSRVRYPTVPLEEVLRLEPDVIIDASSSGTGAEMTAGEVRETWSRWRSAASTCSTRPCGFVQVPGSSKVLRSLRGSCIQRRPGDSRPDRGDAQQAQPKPEWEWPPDAEGDSPDERPVVETSEEWRHILSSWPQRGHSVSSSRSDRERINSNASRHFVQVYS
jgi:iron complex transport system substrate-binding protein